MFIYVTGANVGVNPSCIFIFHHVKAIFWLFLPVYIVFWCGLQILNGAHQRKSFTWFAQVPVPVQRLHNCHRLRILLEKPLVAKHDLVTYSLFRFCVCIFHIVIGCCFNKYSSGTSPSTRTSTVTSPRSSCASSAWSTWRARLCWCATWPSVCGDTPPGTRYTGVCVCMKWYR